MRCRYCVAIDNSHNIDCPQRIIDSLRQDLDQERNRNALLDDLVAKAAYVNDKYEKNRQEMKADIERLQMELAHSDAAHGLEMDSKDRMIAELQRVVKDG
jgi:hypothetical protein